MIVFILLTIIFVPLLLLLLIMSIKHADVDGFTAFLMTLLFYIITTFGTYRQFSFGQVEYNKMLNTREVLQYRIENETSQSIITQNPDLYNQIVDFNNKVIDEKFWSNNVFIGSYFNGKIATLELIRLENR